MVSAIVSIASLTVLAVALAAPASALQASHAHVATAANLFATTPRRRAAISSALRRQSSIPTYAGMTSPVIFPSAFGADPTGHKDSTAAFAEAVAAALQAGSGKKLGGNATDLGGVVIDLQGGDYLISKPIVIPVGYGNMHVMHGTIRASPVFPEDGYLITVGSNACTNNQKSCNENVNFEGLMLDGQARAAGCLQINHTMGGVVGPSMFFLRFNEIGLDINSGHEIMLIESWFGQVLYDNHARINATATAIELDGNDHIVDNVIVFSSKIGLQTTGAANLIKGVHTWNLATVDGGVGIVVDAPQTRLENNYMDYNAMVVIDPSHVVVRDTFFLGGGNLVLKASKPNTTVHGLDVRGSEVNIGNGPLNTSVVLDERDGWFGDILETVIDDTMVSVQWGTPMLKKTSRLTAQMTLSNTDTYVFNLTDHLVFGNVRVAIPSFDSTDGHFYQTRVETPVQGTVITVYTDAPAGGIMTLFVDESAAYSPPVAVDATTGVARPLIR